MPSWSTNCTRSRVMIEDGTYLQSLPDWNDSPGGAFNALASQQLWGTPRTCWPGSLGTETVRLSARLQGRSPVTFWRIMSAQLKTQLQSYHGFIGVSEGLYSPTAEPGLRNLR